MAFPRAFIDGTESLNTATANFLAQIVVEEVNYARMKVTGWIYNEYREVAEAMGFSQYPKVRWDTTILKDIILYMSIISQLVDRRMLSYETALERLGFDFDNELENMKNEFPYVMDGYFGIIGSPWQQAKQGIPFNIPLQDTQRAPEGTPSYGRPKGKPAKKKQKKLASETLRLKLINLSKEFGCSMQDFMDMLLELRDLEDNGE